MNNRSPQGEALAKLILPVLELNSELMKTTRYITAQEGLTPSEWQVLEATLEEPLTVAEISRRVGLGLAKPSVQRTARNLVAKGWAVYLENPRHKTAQLLQPTTLGREASKRILANQIEWANAVGDTIGEEELKVMHQLIHHLTETARTYRPTAGLAKNKK